MNLNGEVEMDALVMCGKTANAGRSPLVIKINIPGFEELPYTILFLGAVTGVRGVKNPIELARLVMERTPHVMLGGEGANQFARQCGVHRVPEYHLVTSYQIDELEKFLHKNEGYEFNAMIEPK